MQLLSELLQISETQGNVEALLESLGKLNVLDRNLVKALKTATSTAKGRKLGPLKKNLGANSEVQTTSVKNYPTAWKRFEDDLSNVVMVIKIDGEQVAAIVHNQRAGEGTGYKGGDTYTIVTSDKLPNYIKDETFDLLSKDYMLPNKFQLSTGTQQGMPEAKVKKFMKLVFGEIMKNKEDVQVMFVKPDAQRAAKKSERYLSKQDSIPLPNDKTMVNLGRRWKTRYEDFLDGAKNDLKARLDKFKSSKAAKAATPEEALKLIKEKGYLDKLEVFGQVYDYYQDRINFNELTGKRKGWGDNAAYIEYRLNKDSPQYAKLKKDIEPTVAALKAEADEKRKTLKQMGLDDSKAFEDYFTASRKLLPPSELKVILGMNGGVIEPKEVQIGKGDGWL